MFERDNWQEIFSTIKKNKLRTFLTAFGVFWGIFMLVIMLGAGKGLQNGVLSEFEGFATNSFYIWAQTTTKPYKGFKAGRDFEYTNEDAAGLMEKVPEVAVMAPRNQLNGYNGGNEVVRKNKSSSFAVMGDYPQYRLITPIQITKGRFLNDNDIKDRKKIAVIGQRVYEILFTKDENPLGEYIRINGVYFKVVGLFKPNKQGGEGVEETQTIYIPFTTFQQAFNFGDRIGWFAITSKSDIPASVAEEKVIAYLKSRHTIAPDDPQAIGHWNTEAQFLKMNGLFEGINVLVWIVGLGTLLAGVIGVSNIMLIIVKERTKEIGIKRALGATPLVVVGQIIMESIFLTGIAGYFGLVSGIWLIELVGKSAGSDGEIFKNPNVELDVALTALIVLIVSGALAGLIPAKRAISIAPVDALRSE